MIKKIFACIKQILSDKKKKNLTNLFYDLMTVRKNGHSFAADMKRMTFITALCLLTGPVCHTQDGRSGCFGMELSSLSYDRTACFITGHQVGPKWSVEGSAEFDFSAVRIKKSTDAEEHDAEFSLAETSRQESVRRFQMAMKFWTGTIYCGPYIQIGCCFSGKGPPDCTAGIGYHMHICKGLYAFMAYESDLIASFRLGSPYGKGCSIGICWIFRKP